MEILLRKLFKVWFVWGLSILIIGIVNGEDIGRDYLALSKSQKRLQEAVNKLRHETEVLETEIGKIKESNDYAKKIFKERYHATESHEKIVFFAD